MVTETPPDTSHGSAIILWLFLCPYGKLGEWNSYSGKRADMQCQPWESVQKKGGQHLASVQVRKILKDLGICRMRSWPRIQVFCVLQNFQYFSTDLIPDILCEHTHSCTHTEFGVVIKFLFQSPESWFSATYVLILLSSPITIFSNLWLNISEN